MRYYPIYLNLTGRPCIVVGGGQIAEGKVLGLLEVEAQVTLITPEATPALQKLAAAGRINWLSSAYRAGDLEGAALAISATDDRTVNEQVWAEAVERGIPINVVDDPPHCDFIAPAIVRRGDLTIAISTNGKAPALAAHLRRVLEGWLGEEYVRFLALAEPLRKELATHERSYVERQQLWRQLLEESEVLDLLRQGDDESALGLAREVLKL
jgi:siroheme synthase-like protein